MLRIDTQIPDDMLLPFQYIPDSPHGLDQTWCAGRILDFLPQISHVNLNDVGFTQEIVAPYAVENRLAIQYLAWVTHKEMQQIIFGRRQFNQATRPRYLARGGIDLQISELEYLTAAAIASIILTTALAPQNRSNTRHQLLEAERFR